MPDKLTTQIHLDGSTCVDRAVARLREFEPAEPYILCFSGGKDSCVLKAVADLAGVKYEAHYHVTTIDPPPLVRFIKRHHPDVIFDQPKHGKSFAQMVGERGFPLRQMRWCCDEFKERSFLGRRLLWGKREAERRASGAVQVVQTCRRTGTQAVNPLTDWSDEEIWSFIRSRRLPYCELYDQGWKRLGCVCCPFTSTADMNRNRQRWPAMFAAILRGFRQRWDEHWSETDIAKRFDGPESLFEAWLRHEGGFEPKEEPDGLW